MTVRLFPFSVFFAIGIGFFLAIAPASALDLPMTQSDIRAAIDYGASTSPHVISGEPARQLGDADSSLKPWGQIITPFAALAFASAEAHAKYENVTNELMREVKAAKTFTVVANAFNTELHMNDDMIVVIKQNGKVIHPVSKSLDSDAEVINMGDEAGYRTSLSAEFSYKTLNLAETFTVAIANYGMSGQETDFLVDPTSFR
ncbi:MAG: hypothetical protein WBW89_00070 [Candidatus Cybelea sp.]